MNIKIIPIVLLLASSLSYAQTTKSKLELPTNPTSPLSAEQIKNLKMKILPMPYLLEKTPPLSYKYTINIEKISKDNPNPIMIYSSSGNGLSDKYISYSSLQSIPYISKCNTNDNRELTCITDTLNIGWKYSINASINNTILAATKKPYDFSVDIQFADLLGLKNTEEGKVQQPIHREIKMNQDFNYKDKTETYVFKSSGDAINSELTEYIFNIKIESNK